MVDCFVAAECVGILVRNNTNDTIRGVPEQQARGGVGSEVNWWHEGVGKWYQEQQQRRSDQ